MLAYRLIPGATKSGKQKTPEWLARIVGRGNQEKPSGSSSRADDNEASPLADED